MNHCSRFITMSIPLNYSNPRDLSEIEKLTEASHLRIQIQQTYEKMYNFLILTFDAYKKCDKTEAERQILVRKKQAVATLLAQGASLGLSVAGGIKGMDAVRKADYLAQSIIPVFQAFTSSPEDFPRSCHKGSEYFNKLSLTLNDFEDLTTQWTITMSATRP